MEQRWQIGGGALGPNGASSQGYWHATVSPASGGTIIVHVGGGDGDVFMQGYMLNAPTWLRFKKGNQTPLNNLFYMKNDGVGLQCSAKLMIMVQIST